VAISGLLLRRPLEVALRGIALWAVVAVPLLLLAAPTAQALWVEDPTPWRARPLVAGDTVAFYLTKLAAPVGLCVDYARTPRMVLQSRLAGPMALAMAGAAGLVLATGSRTAMTAAVLFLGPILPVLGLTPFLQQNMSTVADRYVYQAMLGPALGLAAAVSWASSRAGGKLAARAAGAALLLLVPVDLHLGRFWRDGDMLFARCAAVNPRSWVAQHTRGVAALNRGDAARAVGFLEKALELRPAYWVTEHRIAAAYDALGRGADAERHREVSKDGYVAMMLDKADRLGASGRIREAGGVYLEILKLRPEHPIARDRLARIVASMKPPSS
jgi:hypothetical protein